MAKQTITALYDSREYANNAMLQLQQAGVPMSDVALSPNDAGTAHTDATGRPATGFWASLETMFGGTDDHDTYAEGVRRGGILLTAHVEQTKVDDAIDILERHGSVDLDERESTWSNEGWTRSTALGAVGGLAATEDRSVMALASTDTTAHPTPVMPMTTAARSTAQSVGEDETLKVVEERLNVGKREVNRGKVRVHSYVVETPVTESVALRKETVTVDRRPVDRPIAAADLAATAFTDRTIEAQEVDEEAVVGKTARVVEEINVSKTAEDRVQTINDTVRSTKVEVEDGRTAGGVGLAATGGYATRIKDDMDVIGSDGTHVGVIDHVQGGSMKLKKNDASSGGRHHLLPTDLIASVATNVTLSVTAAEAMRRWTAA